MKGFSYRFLLLLSSLLVLATGIYFFLFHTSAKDAAIYQQLVNSSNPIKEGFTTYAQQLREYVSKEIWFQEETSLHVKIHSKQSELFFFNEENKLDVVEQMHFVKCVMQEELFYKLADGREAVIKENQRLLVRHANPENPLSWLPLSTPGLIPMQEIRYLEAENASYHYNSQLFIANEVKLWKYQVPSHEIPQDLSPFVPLMEGTAKNVEFVFKGNKLDFHATQLKAVFNQSAM